MYVRWGTFDEEDFQIAVNAGDSRDSSCKQSPSPSTIPRSSGFGVVSFPPEKNVENILLQLPRAVGDVGVRAIIAFIKSFSICALFQRTKETLFRRSGIGPLG